MFGSQIRRSGPRIANEQNRSGSSLRRTTSTRATRKTAFTGGEVISPVLLSVSWVVCTRLTRRNSAPIAVTGHPGVVLAVAAVGGEPVQGVRGPQTQVDGHGEQHAGGSQPGAATGARSRSRWSHGIGQRGRSLGGHGRASVAPETGRLELAALGGLAPLLGVVGGDAQVDASPLVEPLHRRGRPDLEREVVDLRAGPPRRPDPAPGRSRDRRAVCSTTTGCRSGRR